MPSQSRPSRNVWSQSVRQAHPRVEGLEDRTLLNGTSPATPDYDGDGRADLAVYRASTGEFLVRGPDGAEQSRVVGGSGLGRPVAGDYDGDGRLDLAVFQTTGGPLPGASQWTILTAGGESTSQSFGQEGVDIPVPADYDGDGAVDLAVYRPTTSEWFVLGSTVGPFSRSFGAPGIDSPVPADYDGDGRADIAVFRPRSDLTPDAAHWFVLRSTEGPWAMPFGADLIDEPTPGDYDGDGRADIAVYRPESDLMPGAGHWFVLPSTEGAYPLAFGQGGLDRPVAQDYDGDGRTDIAVYRPTTSDWFILQSTGGPTVRRFGLAGDVPVLGPVGVGRQVAPPIELPSSLIAGLANDTAPGGSTNEDRLTFDPTIDGVVTGPAEGKLLFGRFDGGGDPIDLSDALDRFGRFTLGPARLSQINGGALPDGDYTLQLEARRASGAPSLEVDIPFVLDTAAPNIDLLQSGTLNVAPQSLEVLFDERPSDPEAIAFTLVGPGGTAVPIASVMADNASVRLSFDAPLADGDYQLTVGPFSDLAGNASAGAAAFAFAVAQPVAIRELSPTDGEELVNVTRETIVRFDDRVDPSTVTADSFFLTALGGPVAGRIRVSSTERFATFFYDAPLPASTEVRVTVDGDRIIGRDGLPIDADGDGLPGGVARADFRTLSLTRIPGTNVFGRVLDSYTGLPIAGATIRVDAFPEANAVTDADGNFELVDMPAPDFFVHVDGSTATNAPDGFTYPSVGKPFHSIPGQRVPLEMNGAPFDVNLPPMALGDIQSLSPTATTPIGFGPAGLAELQTLLPDIDPAAFARTQVLFPANSAIDDFGNPATRAVIIPVPPDRLPAPLPPNLDPKLVISIQAPGATNFDVPAPIQFPNLEGLSPGEQSLLFSFNHDAGRFEVIGTGTVSADGLMIVSDPGVGVPAPGWHFAQPGVSADDDNPEEPPDPMTWDEIAETLNGDYDAKRGTGAGALAHQIACIAQVACDNQDLWGGGFVQDVFGGIADNVQHVNAEDFLPNRISPAAERICDIIPSWAIGDIISTGDICAVVGGFGRHFPYELLPGFARNANRLHDDLDGNGEFDHQQLFEEAVVPCFDQLVSAGEISPWAAALAQRIVPTFAGLLREAIWSVRGILTDLGIAEPAVRTIATVAAAGMNVFPTLPPAPSRGDLYFDGLNDIGTLHVEAADGSFFLPVGSATQLKVTRRNPDGTTTDLTAADGSLYFAAVVDNGVSIGRDGRMTVTDTIAPIPNIPTMLYVVVRNGADVGIGQFAVTDVDTDGDLLVDSFERRIGVDPVVVNGPRADADGDRLGDLFEAVLGTNPLVSDTDGDRIADNVEIRAGTNVSQISTGDLVPQASPHFYALQDPNNGFIQRGLTLRNGALSNIVLAPNTTYRYSILQPGTLRVGTTEFITPASGRRLELPPLLLGTADSTDTDGDGITDEGEFVLGTDPRVADSDGDGIPDAAELEQGLNPLDDRGFPTGVIASLDLPGTAEAVAVEGDLAYVATGGHGLAIVDGARFDRPILLGQIELPGTSATDVGVDPGLRIAAVAAGGSLELVDVSDPMVPRVRQSVGIGASKVEVANGLAYATSGRFFRVVDLTTGGVIQTLILPGSGEVTGMAREGDVIYAYISGSDTFLTIDISEEGAAAVRGQLNVSIASTDVGLFVGNGVAWLAGSGLRTIDVRDPARPTLIGDADSFFSAHRVALNGSGLGLVAPDGGSSIDIYDTSDPNATARFLTRFNLTGPAGDVAISRGIAYLGAGNRLEVVNYRPFDTQGRAPTVAISTSAADADPATDGLQVIEGTAIPVQAAVLDDVQVRNVELLVNGQVVANDVSFPFDVFAIAPNVADGAASVALQFRATDTGGNVATSDVLTLGLVRDTFAPTINSLDPPDGSRRFQGQRTVRVRFSEPIADLGASAENFRLVSAGPNGIIGDSDDVQVPAAVQLRDDDRLVQLTTDPLPAGTYRLVIRESGVTDRVGNPLGTGDRISTFEVVEFEGSADFLPFGTDIFINQDDVSIEVAPIPFPFEFFGQLVAGPMFVTSNGVVEFDANTVRGTFSNFGLPSGNRVMAAPFFDDLDPRFGGRIGLFDGEGVRAVTWEDLPYFSDTTRTASFQIAFLSNGVVQVRYGAIDPIADGSATIGLARGGTAAVPGPGLIANRPDAAITDGSGLLDNNGLGTLDELPGNDLLIFTPDGAGGYLITQNPIRSGSAGLSTLASASSITAAIDELLESEVDLGKLPVPSKGS